MTVPRTRVKSRPFPWTAFTVVILIGIAFSLPAAAASNGDGKSRIFQCDFKNGGVTFSDNRCKDAKKVTTWNPRKQPMGIQGVDGKFTMQPVGKVALQGRSEPFADCKAKGGSYRVSSRICVLPAADAKNVIKRVN